jgi:hypothetical protein
MLKRDARASRCAPSTTCGGAAASWRWAVSGGGVEFVHGDVRAPDDVTDAGGFDLLLNAPPSPPSTRDTTAVAYVIQTNLGGTVHCSPRGNIAPP